MIEAWKKLETVVVLDHQWTASCRFADIVLPVTTRFERNDIEQFGTHSNKGLMALHQIVKPQYEARHDFDVLLDYVNALTKRRCTAKTVMKCSGYRRFTMKA